MIKKISPFILSLLLSFGGLSFAQEFGAISQEELLMTSFEEDPQADVLILFDKAHITFDNDFNLYFNHQKRVKILTAAGKEYANIKIAIQKSDEITDIEAFCYTPSGDEFELDEDNIFDEKTGSFNFKKFVIPGAQIGSVIEYQYTRISESISSWEPWFFQTNAYTKFSQISIDMPDELKYSVYTENFGLLDIKESSQKVFSNRRRATNFKWTGQNIDAIRQEPNMTVPVDYYAKLMFQIVSYTTKYSQYKYSTSWRNIAENNYQSWFGTKLKQTGAHNDYIKTKTEKLSGAMEKAAAIYDYVKEKIKTENFNTISTSDAMADIYSKKGTSASGKNIFLLNLLINEGFSANPILISLKNNGNVNEQWIAASQFNHTIVQLKIDGKTYFLDANNKFVPFGYLTPNFQVERGLLMTESMAQFINIHSVKSKNNINIESLAQVNTDGSINMISAVTYKGYYAISERTDVDKSQNLRQLISSKLDNFETETKIDTFYYTDLETIEQPLNLTIKYSIINAAEINDNLISFTAPFFSKSNYNPYATEKRNFPVDYQYTFKQKEILKINFPVNFVLNEKPENSTRKIEKFYYSKFYMPAENGMECRRTYEINRTHFSRKEYPTLKGLFDTIVRSDQDTIILEKLKMEL